MLKCILENAIALKKDLKELDSEVDGVSPFYQKNLEKANSFHIKNIENIEESFAV